MVAQILDIKKTTLAANDVAETLKPGSLWLRWEPHIHAPGTLLEDKFNGDNPLDQYLSRINAATPPIRALGVTDYYSLSTYKTVNNAKLAGCLPNCDFIFPNVEMRLGIGTTRGKWVNIHMLICPDEADHIEQAERVMGRLTFQAHGDTFNCTERDLIRLGKAADKSITDDRAAMRHGALQFKISLETLQRVYRESDWAKQNILFAVAGNQTDGSSGVRDAADATLRQEIDQFSHIIFSADPAQREFWLGRKADTPEEIKNRYGSLKPCLHGSDAHEHGKIGNPDLNRYTWIKGIPSFDTLRQACIDPAGRAFIGEEPPISTLPSQAISKLNIVGTGWAKTPYIQLNTGLVTIIGARGSGKTALAEIIAAGCDALPESLPEKSFLVRAAPELKGAKVELEWGGDAANPEKRELDSICTHSTSYSRARYLSQQFVDDLCSSDGVDDKLLHEVERVIFEAHDVNQKDGAISFDELLDRRASTSRARRKREQEGLESLAEQIGVELDKIKMIETLTSQVTDKEKLISQYTADRGKLICKGSEKETEKLNELNEAADKVRANVRYFSAQAQSLQAVNDEVNNVRTIEAPQSLRLMQSKHAAARIEPENWNNFLLSFSGDVDALIAKQISEATHNLEGWKGKAPENVDETKSLISDGTVLDKLPLAILEAEILRLQNLVSTDKAVAEKYKSVSQKISQETALLKSLQEKLEDCKGAKDRADLLRKERDQAYQRVFDALLEEEQILKELYAPVMAKLDGTTGTLSKMSFTVQRIAKLEEWTKEGEKLLDLRTGPFKGVGTLMEKANEIKEAWEKGTSDNVLKAMEKFRNDNQTDLLNCSLVSKDNASAYKVWAMKFAKWLYCTDHIEIIYSVDYEGVDIKKLSPGTRGIVLLLLYLALDDTDDRPLIIDQPEENLDPKSIYDELVALFIAAKGKRQVIMVTHNANLVVNTDADQIIIASLGARTSSGMPEIYYQSGGLEEEYIRKEVCNILEGGEAAFKERARRLRVGLER